MSEAIGPDSRVTLHYRMALDDGTEVDSSFGDEPLSFRMGDGSLVAGLEELLVGLAVGARERFMVGPGQAFGYHDPDNIQSVERSAFGPEIPLEPGTVIEFSTPAGDEVLGTVMEADAETVRVDFNHPLAGRSFVFEVEILEVS